MNISLTNSLIIIVDDILKEDADNQLFSFRHFQSPAALIRSCYNHNSLGALRVFLLRSVYNIKMIVLHTNE